jgi:hypothetical protein
VEGEGGVAGLEGHGRARNGAVLRVVNDAVEGGKDGGEGGEGGKREHESKREKNAE